MISVKEASPPMPALRREVIREALLRRIGSGELAPGERIVEARLAGEFGVSAIPVREAIRELVSIGVLEFANHRGAWVRVRMGREYWYTVRRDSVPSEAMCRSR